MLFLLKTVAVAPYCLQLRLANVLHKVLCASEEGPARQLSTLCLVQGLRSLLKSPSVLAALHQDPTNLKPVSPLCTMHDWLDR